MKRILIIVIVLMISACSSSSKKPVDKMYYRFAENNIEPLEKLNIEVKRPSAMGILGNRPMVVQTNDSGLIQMSSNFWLDSPKVLLQNYLQEIFIQHEDNASLTLNSQILALEKKQNEALLTIEFTLTNQDNKLIFNHTYKGHKQLLNNSIPAFANAISILLEEMVQQLSQDIK